MKTDGRRCIKPRASLYETMGNGMQSDGQRKLEQRATKIKATGNKNNTNTRIYSPLGWHIYFIIYPCVIYIRMGINNKLHI